MNESDYFQLNGTALGINGTESTLLLLPNGTVQEASPPSDYFITPPADEKLARCINIVLKADIQVGNMF